MGGRRTPLLHILLLAFIPRLGDSICFRFDYLSLFSQSSSRSILLQALALYLLYLPPPLFYPQGISKELKCFFSLIHLPSPLMSSFFSWRREKGNGKRDSQLRLQLLLHFWFRRLSRAIRYRSICFCFGVCFGFCFGLGSF